jgi:hypothetical protein
LGLLRDWRSRMISDELQERVAKAWFESIPLQYRLEPDCEKGLNGNRLTSSAIIAPPPPRKVAETFFAQYEIAAQNKFAIIKVEMQCGPKRVRLIA